MHAHEKKFECDGSATASPVPDFESRPRSPVEEVVVAFREISRESNRERARAREREIERRGEKK